MELRELVEYLDDYLAVAEVEDYPNALNGLQVEAPGPVSTIAVAVDATAASIEAAVEAGADLLLVHHGLFWAGNLPVTGRRYRRLRALLESGTALYSAHLPLDVHPEVGNNAVLADALGLEVRGGFGEHGGRELGVWGDLRLTRESLWARLDDLLGERINLIPGGPERLERVGVLTGGGGSFVGAAVGAGLDALVTGEGSHHTYFDAMEGGLNLYYGGHYATETWGVRALAEHLGSRFGLDWTFIDQPTGL
ncbi:MAG: Nif3-like dinuclear metal center hexameric protein [Gemmatimonadetes bacterium]|nr:Nif3-like dinuclear metal center hexameric protein [Gemmatimonadota bacterium]NIQ59034.1 Nif3-like dinuclear metal center hexameric protein [Gemmatimonadota bacterium]NIU79242.1 Nif3-like dinuclear metal center hexameric protein [Gammaproteobacteria bacterium]NIX48720.1 Nif3-like dinuclear metal center hexameric protein [Gemmatimonadota bacterium]NIY13171.1 Nif3-like dinuclear metal center hexameric protein [Gemmatimonadota bacterium]